MQRFAGMPGLYDVNISVPLVACKPAMVRIVARWEGCHLDEVDEDSGECPAFGEADVGGGDSDGGGEGDCVYSEKDYDCEREWVRENSWYQEYVEDDHSR